MIVVFDANIFVSALIVPHGYPAQVLEFWMQDKFKLVVSPAILEEVNRVVHYPRIRKKYHLPEEEVARYLQLISIAARIVNPRAYLSVIEKDPSDNRYIECALAAHAEYIITGDAHLLELTNYQGINILSPASFLILYRWESGSR